MGVRGLAPAGSGLRYRVRVRSGLDRGWSDKSKGGCQFFPTMPRSGCISILSFDHMTPFWPNMQMVQHFWCKFYIVM